MQSLKPQDILVVLKLLLLRGEVWSYAELAVALKLSPSQVHASVKRLLAAKLAVKQGEQIVPHRQNLAEFLAHGIRYAFAPERGEITRGIPTGYAAPPLDYHFAPSSELPPVWPDAKGEVRGYSFSPLYSKVPGAARSDPSLYELLALVDAIRGGQARERAIAIRELKGRIQNYD